jgi:hypothetical protein
MYETSVGCLSNPLLAYPICRTSGLEQQLFVSLGLATNQRELRHGELAITRLCWVGFCEGLMQANVAECMSVSCISAIKYPLLIEDAWDEHPVITSIQTAAS